MATPTTDPARRTEAAPARSWRPLRITFVLPNYSFGPVGGFRVVYEYANHLVARGHAVTLVHPRTCRREWGVRTRLATLRWLVQVRRRHWSLVPWFPLDPRVRALLAPDPAAERLPDADVLVATGWGTAAWVATAPAEKGQGLYLVQGHETWSGDQTEVEATWQLPLHKVAISRWLLELLRERGGWETSYIPNGLQHESFGIDVPPEERDAHRVGLLWHWLEAKGCPDALAALEIVRRRVPGLSVAMFGVPARPAGLPDWVDYVQSPSRPALRALYNSCAVFVQPSWSEGWGLTATEAMSCGCALVTADNGGARDYALDGETALVVPPRRPDLLAERIADLLLDDALRHRLAHAGRDQVATFTWSRATRSLEALMLEVAGA